MINRCLGEAAAITSHRNIKGASTKYRRQSRFGSRANLYAHSKPKERINLGARERRPLSKSTAAPTAIITTLGKISLSLDAIINCFTEPKQIQAISDFELAISLAKSVRSNAFGSLIIPEKKPQICPPFS